MAVALVILFIALIVYAANNKQRRLKMLKSNYEQALRGTDKRLALDAGRAYYSALRDNKALTIYDEQAITNDLSTMRVQ